jgi:hypothetical protein
VANLFLTGLLSCLDHVRLLLTSRLSHTIIMRLHSYFFTLCFVVSLGTAANISLIEIVTELPSCAVSFDFWGWGHHWQYTYSLDALPLDWPHRKHRSLIFHQYALMSLYKHLSPLAFKANATTPNKRVCRSFFWVCERHWRKQRSLLSIRNYVAGCRLKVEPGLSP